MYIYSIHPIQSIYNFIASPNVKKNRVYSRHIYDKFRRLSCYTGDVFSSLHYSPLQLLFFSSLFCLFASLLLLFQAWWNPRFHRSDAPVSEEQRRKPVYIDISLAMFFWHRHRYIQRHTKQKDNTSCTPTPQFARVETIAVRAYAQRPVLYNSEILRNGRVDRNTLIACCRSSLKIV